ncbi:MAG: response regulator transcription factor [Ornithinimicrobium sp.]|uniref:winged helix-turn-helix transcriptional regulator n=1 Tax=Ornithinimicrobium sp. TaxID=1977084 RepID=UPI0026E06491|nr:response regulator transcription factor [Ornithinimicrobium sp.]MDO5740266.1 response regulator transcription factor [Ornithinimicrobium sp.]
MAQLVLLTPHTPVTTAVEAVLPGLALLPHRVTVHGMDLGPLVTAEVPDLMVVDTTADLVIGHATLRALAALELGCPVLAVLDDTGLGLVDPQWPAADVVSSAASPSEVAARVRLLLGRPRAATGPIGVADVLVDEESWTVRAGGVPLDLTFKEFELLRYLVQHPGRVVTRDVLLDEVWGLDYYGGTRTVDVHIRRLRAKLGPEREPLIGTIRGVGYRFDGPRRTER